MPTSQSATDKEYLNWLEEYVEWYDRQVGLWYVILMICRFLMFASSVGTAILIAVAEEGTFAKLKWAMLLTSILSTISSQIMQQFQVLKMEALRENGRREFANLHALARDKLFEFRNNSSEIFRLKDSIREQVRSIEKLQAREFVLHFLDKPPQEPNTNQAAGK